MVVDNETREKRVCLDLDYKGQPKFNTIVDKKLVVYSYHQKYKVPKEIIVQKVEET